MSISLLSIRSRKDFSNELCNECITDVGTWQNIINEFHVGDNITLDLPSSLEEYQKYKSSPPLGIDVWVSGFPDNPEMKYEIALELQVLKIEHFLSNLCRGDSDIRPVTSTVVAQTISDEAEQIIIQYDEKEYPHHSQ